MIILSILLSLVMPHLFPNETVTIDFKFKSMKLGKPTLQYYYYDVTLQNKTDELQYVALPRWFDYEITTTGKVWGAQYDSFGKSGGSTLFTDKSFTIITLPPKKKIILTNFVIETFSEEIAKNPSIDIALVICTQVKVGEYSLEDFIKKPELHTENLVYQLLNATSKKISIKVK